MPDMTEREKNILDAAVRAFSRYGVKRTSMADLAEEAGVSRQTLYNAYRNKDDVLRALIRYYTDRAVRETEAALEGTCELGAQLDAVFDKMALSGFDIVQATPNARDIIEGFNATSQDELEVTAERFRVLLEKVLAPHEPALARAGLSAAELSGVLERSAKALSGAARDRDQLVRQLDTLKALCLAATSTSKVLSHAE